MSTKKIKYTNQRVEILAFLRDNYSHPTVEDVFNSVKKKLTRISKATVYQNLKFLSKNGIVRELHLDGLSRFEPDTRPHHHFICEKCGSITDFKSKELTDYSLKISKKIKGVKINSASSNFYGLCEKCKK